MIAGRRVAAARGSVLPWLSAAALRSASVAGQTLTSGAMAGAIVDAAMGMPLSRVLVVDEASGQSVLSDAEGRFDLTLPAGIRRLRVSVVGFVLVRRGSTSR